MSKVILDLCGGTGAWSKPYKQAGYKVYIITLPDLNVLDVDFSEDGMAFKYQHKKYAYYTLVVPYKDVFGILAAPPCTEFSLAKGAAKRDFKSAMDIIEACLKIIWHCRIYGKLKFWALENPVGFLRQFLGKPAFTFKQWQYGNDKIKPTDIWGYFNHPKPTVETKPFRLKSNLGKLSHGVEWSKLETPTEYAYLNELPYSDRRAAIRAITPSGFAMAFFKANNAGILNKDRQLNIYDFENLS